MLSLVLLSGRILPSKKKKQLAKSQKGSYSANHMAWEWLKRLGKARYQTVGLGAGKTVQSDLAQKKAMEILSPMMGEALDKLGDKVAGQQGGFLALVVLGELIPGLVQ